MGSRRSQALHQQPSGVTCTAQTPGMQARPSIAEQAFVKAGAKQHNDHAANKQLQMVSSFPWQTKSPTWFHHFRPFLLGHEGSRLQADHEATPKLESESPRLEQRPGGCSGVFAMPAQQACKRHARYDNGQSFDNLTTPLGVGRGGHQLY